MKEIKEIILCFENGEKMKFDHKCIGDFYIKNIREEITRTISSSIVSYKFTNAFAIELFSNGNEEYGGESRPIKKFDRLMQHSDITSVIVSYDNNGSDRIYLQYKTEPSKTGKDNIYQRTHMSALGNIYIAIGKNKYLAHFFDMTHINNRIKIEDKQRRYGIGIENAEHECSETDLPKYYRIIELINEHNVVAAVRIPDEELGWRYLYYGKTIIYFPKKWKYVSQETEEKMIQQKPEFSKEKLRELYPAAETEGGDWQETAVKQNDDSFRLESGSYSEEDF